MIDNATLSTITALTSAAATLGLAGAALLHLRLIKTQYHDLTAELRTLSAAIHDLALQQAQLLRSILLWQNAPEHSAADLVAEPSPRTPATAPNTKRRRGRQTRGRARTAAATTANTKRRAKRT